MYQLNNDKSCYSNFINVRMKTNLSAQVVLFNKFKKLENTAM